MANVGAAISGAWGGKLTPSDLIATFNDDEEEPDPEAIKREEELQAKLRAADQRALLAALSAATPKK